MTLGERFTQVRSEESDIRDLIDVLVKYGHDCQHITEFGIGDGSSAIAWLFSRPKNLVCYDIGRQPSVDDIARLASENGIDFVFHEANTAHVTINPTDLLFIDTVHNAGQLEHELKNESHVNKFIIMHDTETYGDVGEGGAEGMQYAIDRFLHSKRSEWKLAEHLMESNGLTVLERIGWPKPVSSPITHPKQRSTRCCGSR